MTGFHFAVSNDFPSRQMKSNAGEIFTNVILQELNRKLRLDYEQMKIKLSERYFYSVRTRWEKNLRKEEM